MKKLFFILLITHFSLIIAESQWLQQTVPVNKPITGIKFIDSLKGWAISSSTSNFDTCYILHTSNGGTNWLVQYTTYNSYFAALSVVNENIIYAGGGHTSATANLTKTTNGGLNWSIIPTPTNMFILDMQFLNKDSGWTCGAAVGADVRTTTNGGLNWIVRTSGFAQQTQRIFFINYSTGFCGAYSQFYKTTNAGLNWTSLSSFSSFIKSIYFKNELTGWLGLSPDISSKICYTTNGGLNWSFQSLLPYNSNVTSLYYYNDTIAWAGVGATIIYKTTNMGLNWGYQFNNSQSITMSFLDSSRGWTGWNSISKTTNGGGPIFYTGFVGNSNKTPDRFTLHQNYPNPFNPYTTIKLDLPKASTIRLLICDILGRVLYTIANQYLQAGTYEFNWDALDYTSGVYLYRISSESYTETRKMLLLK